MVSQVNLNKRIQLNQLESKVELSRSKSKDESG